MKKLIMSFLFLLIAISSYSITLQNFITEQDSFKIAYKNIQWANQIAIDLIGSKREIALQERRINNLEKTKDFYKRSADKSKKSDSLCSVIVLKQQQQLKNDSISIKILNKQANKGRIGTLALGISLPIVAILTFIAGIFIAK